MNSIFELPEILKDLPHQAIACNIDRHQFMPSSIKSHLTKNLINCISKWFIATVTYNQNNILCIAIDGWYQQFSHEFSDEFWHKCGHSYALADRGDGNGSLIEFSTRLESNERLNETRVLVFGSDDKDLLDSCQIGLKCAKNWLHYNYPKNKTLDYYNVLIEFHGNAISKSGCSAGVQITLSILSVVLEKPLKKFVVATGEITIDGQILAIAGKFEKLVVAKAFGIRAIFPQENKNAIISRIPKHFCDSVEYADHIQFAIYLISRDMIPKIKTL